MNERQSLISQIRNLQATIKRLARTLHQAGNHPDMPPKGKQILTETATNNGCLTDIINHATTTKEQTK